MKILHILFLIFGLAILVNAQKTVLTGTVYDPNGAIVVNSKITATNQKGERFEAFTKEDGVYKLSLSYNEYKPTNSFKIAKYDITVESNGFEKYILKDFKIIGGYSKQMSLDFALDVLVYIDPITLPTGNKIN